MSLAFFRELFVKSEMPLWLVLIRLVLGLEWFLAGWSKVSNPEFAGGLVKTLGFFVSKNPHSWYVGLVNDQIIPNVAVFAVLVAWGELLAGLSLLSGLLLGVGLLAGIFMNLNFYFAAGWTSPSTASLNLIMIVFQGILFCAVGSRVLGLDWLIAKKFPRLGKALMVYGHK
ncbi:hypothetical protein A3C96_03795 [Candidatus Uhrbacteria bacterium RIFCSPHIGHO2_02_FULL_60_10]|uniref:DoxX family protein n=1 Tax=Candidatus Uhrbacteria bacterium RIFCSPHIGHO2_02_FULL_60_10 TaxID=1802392 RepID=A0A1F7U816_9BACT|nr:MAG: hypothetical protein A3C96_03795 [Candidatus Uhrbacteria bacterium RIFCSPHIGHO2_02_FULL_60_10]